jgi:hypothetical protein
MAPVDHRYLALNPYFSSHVMDAVSLPVFRRISLFHHRIKVTHASQIACHMMISKRNSGLAQLIAEYRESILLLLA